MTTVVQGPPTRTGIWARFHGLPARFLLIGALTGGLCLLLLALAGVFNSKVPSKVPAPQPAEPQLPTAKVRLVRRPRYEAVVGTVRAVHEAAVASKLLARVVEVRVKAGQPVSRDEVLVRLDDADLQARLRQAEAAVVTARAEQQKADRDYERARSLMPIGGISREDLDRRETARKTTAAEVEGAEQRAREAKVFLGYATVRAPIGGIVIDKRVEAGDTVGPGQVLLTLYNPERMQMVVSIRESLALKLAVGQNVRGRLDALNLECQAAISEIVPEVQPASRSFTVKVTGPCPPGAYSGMFGRIFIPLEDEELVVVPANAIFRVGQLDMVQVVEGSAVQRRSIELGRRVGADYEVLAGLRPGERVVLQHLPAATEGR